MFEITPTVSGPLHISTCGPDTLYDTVLQAWIDGGAFLVDAGSSDDFVAAECDFLCSSWDSQLFIDASAGTRYLVQVGSYNQNSGGALCVSHWE